MEITLDRGDLRSEYKNVNCSRTQFQHFSESAQQVIILNGYAVFREYDGSNYNRVYAPKDGKK
jgi:hypothetical protein